MNKKNIMLIIIASVLLIFMIYSITYLFIRVPNKKEQIAELNDKKKKFIFAIKKEKKDQKDIKKTNEELLKNPYFEKESDYFEIYIRNLFNKHSIKIKRYRASFDEKNFSEVSLDFSANAYKFFEMIKDIEEGEKLVVIKSLRIQKGSLRNFNVKMNLLGYYEEDTKDEKENN